MRQKFCGAWATYEYLDDTCEAIKELRRSGFKKITTHAPCPRHEIDHALGNPQSRVPFFTLAGAVFGFGLAILIIYQMTLNWILPVSGKPVLSVPIMGPIAFELAVLLSIFFTAAAILILIVKDTLRYPVPRSREYKTYNRFMRDRFGIVVACDAPDVSKIESIMKKHQAEEVTCET
jgi:ActD protein